MTIKDKLKSIKGAWWFLIIIAVIYTGIYLINPALFNSGINFFLNILIKIIPVIMLIFVLMAITNYCITPEIISKHIKKNHGLMVWIYAIIGGILSAGPIYMWYPLLAELNKKGVSYGLIACFLYNRAIKIPLLPLAILYFGWKLVLILTIVMILASLVQGIIINKLINNK